MTRPVSDVMMSLRKPLDERLDLRVIMIATWARRSASYIKMMMARARGEASMICVTPNRMNFLTYHKHSFSGNESGDTNA